MVDIKEAKVKTEKETKTFGRLVIEPLPSGYGHTLGNALRRILYSSLPGAAIVEVNFAGVLHPFTTIKGVEEDVVELILNLKKVRFVMHIDSLSEAQIEAKGKRVVTAGDIKVGAGVEVANPELRIASLTSKLAKLSVKLLIEKGVGYKLAEERKTSQVGVIPIDSAFSPVIRVVYRVEQTRRGREADLDRLVMEVTTDGTVKPSEALQKAAVILRSYLGLFVSEKRASSKRSARQEKEDASSSVSAAVDLSPEVRKAPLSKLNLASQTSTILTGAGIKSVGGLLKKSKDELLGIKGFGERRVAEVERELGKIGAALKEVVPASPSADEVGKQGG